MSPYDEYDIISNGCTVWINGPLAMIGRFGTMGIDIHGAETDQFAHCTVECLYCTHEPTTAADWETFKEKMLCLHGAVVSDDHKPKRFLVDTASS